MTRLSALFVIKRAIPVGIESLDDVGWVRVAIGLHVLGVHTPAETMSLLGGEQIHEVSKVLLGRLTPLSNQIGFTFHQLAERRAIGRIGSHFDADGIVNLVQLLADESSVFSKRVSQFGETIGLLRIETEFVCNPCDGRNRIIQPLVTKGTSNKEDIEDDRESEQDHEDASFHCCPSLPEPA
jgi:hypothetical protein